MTTGKIFLLNDNGKTLTPMSETGYVAEKDLQTFLADHPDLLPGDQISPESPRRWLLVSREMGVPGAVEESGRWSLDHLFLDQDGVPTFVECKRSQDTRARREVVAQMLDYAANGIEYWSLDSIRQSAAETAQKQGKQLDQLLLDFIDLDPESEMTEAEMLGAFWQTVEQNLRRGKVRLIFVLDQSSRELRRLVEFLNEKMSDVEVLIVEIRQYLGEQQKALVPRVLGITEEARSHKSRAMRGPVIDKDIFLAQCTPAAAKVFDELLNRAANRGHSIHWGSKRFVLKAIDTETNSAVSFIYGTPGDLFEFYFKKLNLMDHEEADLRNELLALAPFEKSGRYTLKMYLSDQNQDALLSACDYIFSWIEARYAQ